MGVLIETTIGLQEELVVRKNPTAHIQASGVVKQPAYSDLSKLLLRSEYPAAAKHCALDRNLH